MKILNLNGYIVKAEGPDYISAKNVENLLKDAGGDDIKVNLHTPGGDVYEALAIYNLIDQYPGKKTLHIGGRVASAGSLLLGAFDRITALDVSVFMYHDAQGISMGTYKDMRNDADKLEKDNTHIGNILAKKTGRPVKDILKEMDAETWLYGQEIKDFGFVDEIINSKQAQDKDAALIQAMDDYKQVAAFMNKTVWNQGNFYPVNNKDKGAAMNKEQILAALPAQGITLLEVANVLGKTDQIVNSEHQKAMNVMAAFKELGIADPVAEIKSLTDKVKADAAAVKKARLDDLFGKEGELRLYADKVISDVTDQAVEEFKKDPLAVSLAKLAAEGDKIFGLNEKGDKVKVPKVKEM